MAKSLKSLLNKINWDDPLVIILAGIIIFYVMKNMNLIEGWKPCVMNEALRGRPAERGGSVGWLEDQCAQGVVDDAQPCSEKVVDGQLGKIPGQCAEDTDWLAIDCTAGGYYSGSKAAGCIEADPSLCADPLAPRSWRSEGVYKPGCDPQKCSEQCQSFITPWFAKCKDGAGHVSVNQRARDMSKTIPRAARGSYMNYVDNFAILCPVGGRP